MRSGWSSRSDLAWVPPKAVVPLAERQPQLGGVPASLRGRYTRACTEAQLADEVLEVESEVEGELEGEVEGVAALMEVAGDAALMEVAGDAALMEAAGDAALMEAAGAIAEVGGEAVMPEEMAADTAAEAVPEAEADASRQAPTAATTTVGEHNVLADLECVHQQRWGDLNCSESVSESVSECIEDDL